MEFSGVYLKGEFETLTKMVERWEALTPLEKDRLWRAFRKLSKQLRSRIHFSQEFMTLYCSAKRNAQQLKERWADEKGSVQDDSTNPPDASRPDDGAAGACVGG